MKRPSINNNPGIAVVRKTGQDPFNGDDLGVYLGNECVRTFNTLSDDYAHTNAQVYADQVNRNETRSKR